MNSQLEKASLLTLPVPIPLELARLTKQVAHNNRFDQPDKTAADEKLFSFLREQIKHVIYIMKENRTYDQVLGDLDIGNGDPRFTLFPEETSPNHHAIARMLVDLDNTLVSGEGSPQGWTWTYAAQTTDYNERNEPHSYNGRGTFNGYGNIRMMNMGYPTNRERHAQFPVSPSDPDVLPGTHDVNAPDGEGRRARATFGPAARVDGSQLGIGSAKGSRTSAGFEPYHNEAAGHVDQQKRRSCGIQIPTITSSSPPIPITGGFENGNGNLPNLPPRILPPT